MTRPGKIGAGWLHDVLAGAELADDRQDTTYWSMTAQPNGEAIRFVLKSFGNVAPW